MGHLTRAGRPIWMRTESLLLSLIMVSASLPQLLAMPTVLAQVEESPSLDNLEQLLKDGRYDAPITHLGEIIRAERAMLERSGGAHETTRLQRAYLLLIESYVLLSNHFRSKGDFVTGQLYEEKAREKILECLQTWELRDVKTDPGRPAGHRARSEVEYPPEMVGLFREVRTAILGSFRIIDLDPPDAVVTLNADSWTYTLTVVAGDSLPGGSSIPAGSCQVRVEAKGYRTFTDDIQISPGATQERSYRLEKNRGPFWYAWRAAFAAAAGIGIALATGSGDDEPTPQPLPEPPPPPSPRPGTAIGAYP